MKIVKEVKESPFKPLKREVYIGKLYYGCPYFYPRNYCPTIISVRRLKERTEQQRNQYIERHPYSQNVKELRFSNLPMVRRSKNFVKKLFGSWWYIEIGYPIMFYSHSLGWKDKYGTPRHEWSPAWYIFFFKWQIRVNYTFGDNEDTYWEMFLWWRDYCGKDLKRAEDSWGWVDGYTNKTTWDKNNLK